MKKLPRESVAQSLAIMSVMPGFNASAAKLVSSSDIYFDSTYQVQTRKIQTEWGKVTHLMIWRHDNQPVRSWPELQRIKNEIAGAARVAIEVYPAQDDVVDERNASHLWVLSEDMEIPFGLHLPGGARS